MKDYTTSHACGLEMIHATLRDARATAKTHLKKCKLTGDARQVYIDQYDHEEGELTGKYWKVG